MYTAQKFSLREFVSWTRRDIYWALLWAAVPTVLYHFLSFTFLAISWVPIASLGTAVSLLVGFKNNVSYNRLWEARQAYGGIITTSRAFAAMARDFLAPTDPAVVPALFDRHYAWLTALRYQLREPRAWENMSSAANREYAKRYHIPENETPLAQELARYLPAEQLVYILSKQNLVTHLLAEQSRHINMLSEELTELQMSELQALILLLGQYQGLTEGLKNFPYPPNFASITTILLYIFVLLVPFGLLNEFDKLGADTLMAGYAVWATIPFAALLMWVFVALDRAGESSSNPFEGSANDVPISSISRSIEIDMRDLLEEPNLPVPLAAVNNVLL